MSSLRFLHDLLFKDSLRAPIRVAFRGCVCAQNLLSYLLSAPRYSSFFACQRSFVSTRSEMPVYCDWTSYRNQNQKKAKFY